MVSQQPSAEDAQPATAPAGRNAVVVTGHGPDRPGIVDTLLQTVESNRCEVLELGQYSMADILVITFTLETSGSSSVRMLQELVDSGKRLGLKLDFQFHHAQQLQVGSPVRTNGNVAAITVVTAQAISPSLLHGLDAVLCEHGCVLYEIEHRSDNMVEHNGEYNKLQLRANCPPGMKLLTLYLGRPGASSEAESLGLQKVAEFHDAMVTVRRWDGMSRPNGKSLVVFELTNVLFPYNLLNEMLREAGVDVAAVVGTAPAEEANPDGHEQKPSAREQMLGKVRLLRGHNSSIVQGIIRRLQLTPGAHLVCGILKAMGFRLAVLTRVVSKEVAEHVRGLLGVDYVLAQELEVRDGVFTGECGGLSGLRFRKSDFLKLMADREGIEYHNVITVGSGFLEDLAASEVRLVLDTYGPFLQFDSRKFGDLAVVLYSLGFNGSHVREMKQAYKPSTPRISNGASCVDKLSMAPAFTAHLTAQTQEPGQILRVCAPLLQFGSEVQVSIIRQCSLQDGGMCLGLELKTPGLEQVAKELLFACNQAGIQADVSLHKRAAPATALRSRGSGYWHSVCLRYIITLVQQPRICMPTLRATFATLATRGVNILKIERLSVQELSALQLVVRLPEELEITELSRQLLGVSAARGADIAIQADDADRWMRRLVVFDMDSTLIQQEVIDELAAIVGVGDEVKGITEAAMRGEIDFFESLRARVALLKGHNAEELFAQVKRNLTFTPGAKCLCSSLKKLGYKMAVISGGFLPLAQEVQRHLGLDYAFANTLEVDEQTGLLTGRTSGPVVTPQRKRALLATIANVEGCKVQQAIAVGDGSNDIPMLNAAGLGIAFCAKPKVQAAADFRINQKDLTTVLFLIGLSEHAIQTMVPSADPTDTLLNGWQGTKRQRLQ